MTREVPVLITGAGPAGLTLACELARRGVACRVIDKAPQLFQGSRAKGLQPRTLEVFDDLGVIDQILAGGAPFPSFRLYAGQELKWERSLEQMLGGPEAKVDATAAAASEGAPYPRAWLIPQWRTDQILHDRFVALGGRVELETELVDFAQDADGVTVTLMSDRVSEKVRARYLVGADGGRSAVRKRSGVAFAGETLATERTLIGDVQVSGLEGVACHILTRAGDATSRFSLWNLPGSEHYQLVANIPGDDASAPELSLTGVQRLLEERTGRRDVRLHDLRWISLYRVNVRMAERFRIGRVFLAGDAAHVHSSAGGQGLNTSVQDAYNLGWKLAAAIGGAADGEALLDSYEQERLPVAAAVLGLSSKLHRQGFGPPAAGAATPALHQLDLSYRGGPLAVDDRAARGALQAGDRAPDAPLPGRGDGKRLFDLLRGPHFTLLVFGERAERLEGDARVAVAEVGALPGYDVEAGQLVLIRPDGYIGAITASLETLRAYLTRMG
jgi:2-polyprenyl-6-methoxyphenol hydroxylase-like FAD-dependent oxidoreductase